MGMSFVLYLQWFLSKKYIKWVFWFLLSVLAFQNQQSADCSGLHIRICSVMLKNIKTKVLDR